MTGFPDTRWSLVGRLGGDPQHAATVIDLYADSIQRYLRLRLAGELPAADLDDVVQDTLVHLLEHPDVLARARPGDGSRFRYYLMTVALNAARNAVRRRRRARGAQAHVDELPDHADPSPDQMVAMDRAWAQSVVAQAWDELRAWVDAGDLEPDVLTVLDAHLVHGRPLRSIADELGIGLATCSRRLAKGRTLLQQALVERLRHSGDLRADEDAAIASERLLAALA